MARKNKARDVRNERKWDVYNYIREQLESVESVQEVLTGDVTGLASNTLVARFADVDIQIKVISPALKNVDGRYTPPADKDGQKE